MRRIVSAAATLGAAGLVVFVVASAAAGPAAGTSGAVVPPGFQSGRAYAGSNATAGVTNTYATTQVSCYRPEVPALFDDGPALGYDGMSACPGAATGEDPGAAGPHPTQIGSNPGRPRPYPPANRRNPGDPAATPIVGKDPSESDIRIDPSNSQHVIGTSKW